MKARRMGWAVLAAVALAGGPAWAQGARGTDLRREAALFEFLAAEIAAQRGEAGAAVATMSRLARELRDPQIARRAVELAIRARAVGPALELGGLLVELEPDTSLGRDLIASLVGNRDLADARESIRLLIDASGDKPLLISQLPHFFARFSDRAAVYDAVKDLVAPHDKLAESHYALGVSAHVAGKTAEAKAHSLAALAARPDWAQAAILHAQVLRKDSPDRVIPFYREFLAAHPDAKDAWTQLAREYATARKLPEAREAFRAAAKLSPGDALMPYAVGLVSLQMEDWADAEASFRRALGLGHPDPGAVHLALGQVAEGQKRVDEAIDWYRRVDSTEWSRAQMRIATLLAKRDGLAKGREYLKGVEPRTQEDRIQMVQVEAQLLRDAKAWKDTYDILTQAVEKFPESFELLYDRAMAAERVDKLDVLEKDLRRVIELKPDYAHAYNALGYTLADRTDRIDEAAKLVEKAVSLSPDDPFILDSLGWVRYRQGRLDEALETLTKAHKARPDPEIAAHLGEVLWKLGRHEEARGVWQAALKDNPGHETLTAVIQKFRN
jgi:tetratricopeptide (TPR) repeat protein